MPRKRFESPARGRNRGPRKQRTGDREKPSTRGADTLAELQKTNRELNVQLRDLRDHQKNLEQVGARYTDLFDFAPVTYALLDSAGIVVRVNLAGCRLLDVERE